MSCVTHIPAYNLTMAIQLRRPYFKVLSTTGWNFLIKIELKVSRESRLILTISFAEQSSILFQLRLLKVNPTSIEKIKQKSQIFYRVDKCYKSIFFLFIKINLSRYSKCCLYRVPNINIETASQLGDDLCCQMHCEELSQRAKSWTSYKINKKMYE